MKTNFLILAGLLSLLGSAHAQISSISVAATSESIALPFTRYAPLHPGFEIGATLGQKESPKTIQQFNVRLGGYFHERLENAIYVGGAYQLTWKVFPVIGLDVQGGLGYLHSFYPGELYQITDSGSFDKVSQVGRPHFYSHLGIGFRYLNESKIEPFIHQELLIETPFANSIPVMVHSIVKIGVNVKIN